MVAYSSTHIHSNMTSKLPSGCATFWNTNLLSTLSTNSIYSSKSLSLPLYRTYMTNASLLCVCSKSTGSAPARFITSSMTMRREP